MRPLAPADLSVAVRALLAMPEGARDRAVMRMIAVAEAADRHRMATGKWHPVWGNGSLEGAARAWPLAPPRALGDAEGLSCLGGLISALARRAALCG